jgi:hypothetical protein
MLGQICIKLDVGETLLIDYYHDAVGGLVTPRREEARPKAVPKKVIGSG